MRIIYMKGLKMMFKYLIVLCLITMVCGAWDTTAYERLAMLQPGINSARASDDGLHFMIALQRSSTGDNAAIAKVISNLVWTYGLDNHTGVLQIGLTNNQDRVTAVWEVSSFDVKANQNNTTWLTQIIRSPTIFDDDTRNYDPYGNRYTPIQNGKGILGSLIVPWLYGN